MIGTKNVKLSDLPLKTLALELPAPEILGVYVSVRNIPETI
ncbi:hypothetical protein [Bacillus cereus]|nr:hypothetical protein [Bacillus cereus]